jgi:hypothetical protein
MWYGLRITPFGGELFWSVFYADDTIPRDYVRLLQKQATERQAPVLIELFYWSQNQWSLVSSFTTVPTVSFKTPSP